MLSNLRFARRISAILGGSRHSNTPVNNWWTPVGHIFGRNDGVAVGCVCLWITDRRSIIARPHHQNGGFTHLQTNRPAIVRPSMRPARVLEFLARRADEYVNSVVADHLRQAEDFFDKARERFESALPESSQDYVINLLN